MTVAALQGGSASRTGPLRRATWTNIVTNNFANNNTAYPPTLNWSEGLGLSNQACCFPDLRNVKGDGTYFMLAYQTGHMSGDAPIYDAVVVDKRPAATRTR